MPRLNQGVLYEANLYGMFTSALSAVLTVLPQAGGHGIDIPFVHPACPRPLGIEAKRRHTDTMAGTSLRFSDGALCETPVKPVDAFNTVFPAIRDRITQPILDYMRRANELILAFNTTAPVHYKPVTGFPAIIPVPVRKQMIAEGYQKKIQSTYDFSLEAWKAFYRAKGSSYIQIGDRGFFHMGENPLNLPVPELLGSISLEVRLYAAGTNGNPYARVEIALKFKRLSCTVSPYTLDNPAHIAQLFTPSPGATALSAQSDSLAAAERRFQSACMPCSSPEPAPSARSLEEMSE
jgi:hypothetical protein